MTSPTKPVITGLAVCLVCLIAASPLAAQDKDGPSPKTIVERALEQNSMEFDSGRAKMRMAIEGKNGDSAERKLVVKTKNIDDRPRTLIELTAPDELKGQSFLFVDRAEGDDDVWMYVPAFSVTRRIEGSKKQGAFLGSHFTYSDLESRDVRQADYERLEDEKVGKHDAYVIQATPNKKVDSEYGKVVAFIRKKDFAPLRFRFYDDEEELRKTLFVERLGETEEGGSYVEQMQMRSERGGYTRIEVESMDPGADFPDSIFTKSQLGK